MRVQESQTSRVEGKANAKTLHPAINSAEAELRPRCRFVRRQTGLSHPPENTISCIPKLNVILPDDLAGEATLTVEGRYSVTNADHPEWRVSIAIRFLAAPRIPARRGERVRRTRIKKRQTNPNPNIETTEPMLLKRRGISPNRQRTNSEIACLGRNRWQRRSDPPRRDATLHPMG